MSIVDTVFNSIRTCSQNIGYLTAGILLLSFAQFLATFATTTSLASLLYYMSNTYIPTLTQNELGEYEGSINNIPQYLIMQYVNYIRNNGFIGCVVSNALTWKSPLAAALAGIEIKVQPSELEIVETQCEVITKFKIIVK
jgi:hypothetical protein